MAEGAEVPTAAPSATKAIHMVAGIDVEPALMIDAAMPGALEQLDLQWHEKAWPVLAGPGSGTFLILPPGGGGAAVGWAPVKDIAAPGLPSRIAAATGTPEFVALSADGTHLCAATEEGYEYWIIVRSLG
ncbi:hypothetical protein [Streptomyces sp. MCL20-2]|uniref:hypothetical protein n=1 Tax=Streptomyces sp. MCL20-2 TaxID=2967219 RepID=UPI0029674286|nr:hypothetical protein [Streptomyces sp. MCL20-2]